MKKRMTPGFVLFFLWFGLVHLCVRCTGQNGNPRHPGVVHFEEIGQLPPGYLWPLGDISGDGIADIAIEHFLDTGISPGRPAQELLILHGVAGGLPLYDVEKRLEPGQLLSKSLIMAVGDWDGWNGPDLCIYTILYHDTAFGNKDLQYDGTGMVLIYWNDGTGGYSLSDTSRLYPEIPGGFVVGQGCSGDWDGDGVEDLFLKGTGTSRRHSGIENIPKGFIYRGHSGGRWGRGGIANTPDWQWWNAPNTSRLDAEDLDQDGAMDVVLYSYDNASSRPLSVLYGRHDGALPDTLADLQQVDMVSVGGWATNFADVTGDQVADLVVLNSPQSLVYIYVGCKGQRLLEQFGTGNDPPEGERWWGKPWATLKGPSHVSSAWFGLEQKLFDLGSADTNATEEIWVVSVPSVLCYEVSGWVSDGVQYGLDSIFDGEIAMRVSDARRLGDIDGSGRSSFALVGSDGVDFYRTAESVRLPTPTFWRVPACDTSLSTVGEQEDMKDGLGVEVLPNPTSGHVRIRWRNAEAERRGNGEVRITVHDVVGQEVTSFTVGADTNEAVWDASSAAGSGLYYISATIGEKSETIGVLLQ